MAPLAVALTQIESIFIMGGRYKEGDLSGVIARRQLLLAAGNGAIASALLSAGRQLSTQGIVAPGTTVHKIQPHHESGLLALRPTLNIEPEVRFGGTAGIR